MGSQLADLPRLLPAWFLPLALGLFGLMVGSFLNVVVHRLPRGLSIARPRRSFCPSCERTIPWHENLPIVSWLVLRGRCSACRAPISSRYLVLEALTAATTLACYFVVGWTPALPVALLFGYLLLALGFTDLEHIILPDAITLPGTFAGLALSFVSPLVRGPAEALLGVLLAIVLVEGINLAYRILRGRDGWGAGDTKMLMMIGAFLGWRLGIFTLLAASVIGALVGVPFLLWRARGRARDASATAPEPDASGAATGGATAERMDDEDEAAASTGGSVLAELVPRTPEELLAPLTFLALVLSFSLPQTSPERALAGLLIGLLLMFGVNRVLDRGPGPPAAARGLARRRELLPLLGAVAGCPASVASAAAAAGLALLYFALSPLLARWLPGLPETEPEQDDPGPAAPLLQAELPFGVFLAVGALVSLLAGEGIIDWYLGLMMPALE